MNQWGITTGERQVQRLSYIRAASIDPIAQDAWKYYGFGSYAGITYGKTASALLTLESIVGEETMQKAMHTYFMKYRFTHPTKEDFLKTIEEVSGKDLHWYFNQSIYGSQVFDYEVLRIDSIPTQWDKEDLKEKKGETEYTSAVWLHRKDDFVFPVDVDVKFDNDEKVREHWDGRDRWIKYVYQKKAKVVSAEIDPEHRVFLDTNDFNNSRTKEGHAAPARKVTNYWTFLNQLFAQVLAWFAV